MELNPILALLDHNIYECTGEDLLTGNDHDGIYHFLTKGLHILEGTLIRYKNINSHVIRINDERERNNYGI